MLTDIERKEIDEERQHAETAKSASLEALKIVQKHRGWVSDEALRAVADHLGLSAAELDGVATFYNLIFRRAVGRHVILICSSVSCWILGSTALQQRLKAHLKVEEGETTADGRFTLLPMACLGACDGGPAFMVDQDLHRGVTPEKVANILEGYP